MKSRFMIMVVPEGGKYFLTIPESAAKEVGWKDGDEVRIDIPTTYPDQIIIARTNA